MTKHKLESIGDNQFLLDSVQVTAVHDDGEQVTFEYEDGTQISLTPEQVTTTYQF